MKTLMCWLTPFAYSSGTYCTQCRNHFPLSAFVWADTGESITAYRKRLRTTAPSGIKLCAWYLGPAIEMAVGALVGVVLILSGVEFHRLLFLVFMIFGLVLGYAIGLWIGQSIWGIDYRKEK